MSLRNGGSGLLACVQKATDSLGIRTVIMWGTLLGHVRDGGFISYDNDIDLCMFPEDVAKLSELERNSTLFGLHFAFRSPYLLRLCFPRNPHLHVDIWVFYREGSNYLLCMNRRLVGLYCYRLPQVLFARDERVTFEGVAVSAPVQPEPILELLYGPWRVPDAAFSEDDSPAATILLEPPRHQYIAPARPCFETWTRRNHVWSPHVRLDFGDPAPPFSQRASVRDFDFAGLRGRTIALCFFGTTSLPESRRTIMHVLRHRSLFDEQRLSFIGITADRRDEARLPADVTGIDFIWDFDDRVSILYGAIDPVQRNEGRTGLRPFWLILDPSSTVIASLPLMGTENDHFVFFAFLKHLSIAGA